MTVRAQQEVVIDSARPALLFERGEHVVLHVLHVVGVSDEVGEDGLEIELVAFGYQQVQLGEKEDDGQLHQEGVAGDGLEEQPRLLETGSQRSVPQTALDVGAGRHEDDAADVVKEAQELEGRQAATAHLRQLEGRPADGDFMVTDPTSAGVNVNDV